MSLGTILGLNLTSQSLLRKTNITSVSEKRQEEEESQNMSRAGGGIISFDNGEIMGKLRKVNKGI